MSYTTVFEPVPWEAVALTACQAFIIYWIVLLGLRLIGRRVFGEMGPQDLILLLLISESTDLGIVHQEAGFWGTLSAVLTLLATVGIMERLPRLRRVLENSPIKLKENGRLLEKVIQKNLVEDDDLNRVAHDYGMCDHEVFESMILEGDGKITGVLKPELRMPYHRGEKPSAGSL